MSSSLSGSSPLDAARAVAARVRARARHDVMGRDEVIDLSLIALLSGGHVLLEDYPGSGKTTLAKALGESLSSSLEGAGAAQGAAPIAPFRRVQFTPDMLPSDITGVMIFDAHTQEFRFRPGPVFAHVLLVDEINRTSPKVQSAMLEAMAERQVTVDNKTYALDPLFFVIATQNPLDSVGTYPLPVAQLDRFLFKVRMKHIDRAAELEVLSAWGLPREREALPGVSRDEVLAARAAIQRDVFVSEAVRVCLVDAARAVREDKRCAQGVSTRSLVQGLPALQARAALAGRDFVSAEDVEALSGPLFEHRLTLIPGVRDAQGLIADALRAPLEALSRATLSARVR
ncbi:MAG: AAA family ATPase [Deltaproteobacteria bacterium]|nr:AAA family ATPase [Deltaproteobacteria bacterium]